MASRGINKVIILGNLGKDPEVRYMPSGGQVTNITVATSETWKDKDNGETKENTEWHRIVFFNRLAEIAGEYLKKGSQVYIEGRLQTRKWQGQDGQDRYSTEIVASEMQMIGGRSGGGSGGGAGSSGGPMGGQQDDDGYSSTPPARGGARAAAPAARSGGGNRDSYGAPPPPPRAPAKADPGFGEDDIPF